MRCERWRLRSRISMVLKRWTRRSRRAAIRVYAHLLYEALGNLYIEKERYQDAALAYEAFAKRRPDDRYAPSLQMRTIEAYQKGGFASLVLEGKQAFVERYAFGSAFWAQRTVPMRLRWLLSSSRIRRILPSTTMHRRRNRRRPRTTRLRLAGIARCSTPSRRMRKRRRLAISCRRSCSNRDVSPKRLESTNAPRTTIRCTRNLRRQAMPR